MSTWNDGLGIKRAAGGGDKISQLIFIICCRSPSATIFARALVLPIRSSRRQIRTVLSTASSLLSLYGSGSEASPTRFKCRYASVP